MSKFYNELGLLREHIKEKPKKPNKILWFFDEVVFGGIGRLFTTLFRGIFWAIGVSITLVVIIAIGLILWSIPIAIVRVALGI